MVHLETLKEKVFQVLNINDNTHKIFVHFPPNWWTLHIHFVSNNHKLGCPPKHAFFLEDIISNLKKDSDYYRKRVEIISS